MFNSIKFKITIIGFLLIATIMIGNVWKDIKRTENKLLNTQKEKTALLSDRIVHGIMVLMLKNQWQDLQSSMESLVREGRELKEVRVFSADTGYIVVSSDPNEVGKRIYDEDLSKFRRGLTDPFLIKKNGVSYTSKLSIIENHAVCHRCHDPEQNPLGVLDVEISLDTVQQTIQNYKKEQLTEGIIGFFLLLCTFLFIVGILIDRPINKMIKTIGQIEKGDLSARMDINKKDELGHLAKSFNNMIESLESANRKIEKYHQNQIQRAAKLASLGEVAAGIAHEIRNPLAGISFAMQIFKSELGEKDERIGTINEVLSQIKRLDRTVKDLLRYAKPAPKRVIPSLIHDVFEKARSLAFPEAKKQNVSMKSVIEKDIPEILMDPDQIQQVFLNLMINAIQAMPSGGMLTVSIGLKNCADISKEIGRNFDCDRMLAAEFRDSGGGILPEDVKKIFDPFFTKKTKGTGLGLSISQRIVREHGGELTCRNHEDGGAIFTIYLPVTDKTDEELT
jgi:signal transduction histidine kinase